MEKAKKIAEIAQHKKPAMNQIEVTINRIVQEKIGLEDGLSWFDALDLVGQKEAIRNLILFIKQAHPDKDSIAKGLESAPIKKTMTPVVLLKVNENFKVALDKIGSLPDSEIRNSYMTLVSVFKAADRNRRQTQCKNGCTHEWHNLSPNTMEPNQTLTFHPKKAKLLKYIFIALAIDLTGIVFIYGGQMEGWFALVFGVMVSAVVIAQFLPNATYIRLTSQGFEIRALYRSWFVKWDEVEQFGYGSIKGREYVVFNYSKNHTRNKTMKYLGRAISGVEGGCDTLGHPSKEMVKVFNEWKAKYSGKH